MIRLLPQEQIRKRDQFKVGMKLEAKDRLNPSLVAVATISDIREGQLLIHFDGWTDKYDYWCQPTSNDIHPHGWCAKHMKTLQPPKGKGKPTPGHHDIIIIACTTMI